MKLIYVVNSVYSDEEEDDDVEHPTDQSTSTSASKTEVSEDEEQEIKGAEGTDFEDQNSEAKHTYIALIMHIICMYIYILLRSS